MSVNKVSIGRLRYTIKKKKNNEVFLILQEYGVDAYVKDLGSALSIACMTQNWEIAKYCLEKGADVNPLDIEGGTALIDTCKFGNIEIVKLLIEAGAEINIQNKYDKSAIAKAIAHHPQNYELIQLLIDNGADPFLQESYRRDDPRITTYNAYEYALSEIKDEQLMKILDKAKDKR